MLTKGCVQACGHICSLFADFALADFALVLAIIKPRSEILKIKIKETKAGRDRHDSVNEKEALKMMALLVLEPVLDKESPVSKRPPNTDVLAAIISFGNAVRL